MGKKGASNFGRILFKIFPQKNLKKMSKKTRKKRRESLEDILSRYRNHR